MAKKSAGAKTSPGRTDLPVSRGEGEAAQQRRPTTKHSLARRTREGRGEGRPSSLLDTRVVYCGDNLEQLANLLDACCKPMQNGCNYS